MAKKVLRADVVAMCEALNFPTASKWNREKTQERLKMIAEQFAGETIPADVEGADRLNDLLRDVVEAKGEVEVVRTAEELGPPEPEVGEEAAGDEAADVVDAGAVEADAEASGGEEPGPEPEGPPPADEKPAKAKRGGKGKKAGGKAEKPEGKDDGKGANRAKVLGKYSAGPFVRWLGIRGVGFDGAREILSGEGVELKDVSVRWELKERREGHGPADVSRDDARSLKGKYPGAFAKGK